MTLPTLAIMPVSLTWWDSWRYRPCLNDNFDDDDEGDVEKYEKILREGEKKCFDKR